ncbi:MAG: leucine-rich repeat protein [Clostridia bacterium]|nr:leucine-rich repeat protein [Clostridia bacterium]
MLKKLLALLMALMMLCSACAALADNSVEYSGGVVMRGFPKGTDVRAAAENLINVAYVECNVPYFVIGESTTWKLGIEGGTEPYSIDLQLFYQAFSATNNMYWGRGSLTLDNERTFSYTFTEEGRYFWQITVTDSTGQYLIFQSRSMETATEEDEKDEMTVAGKVNQIIAEEITDDMSGYARALALHDWLIYNANYDYTYSHYDASGVLLYGTGVCDSYARAYQMLCTAAGIECLYVSGTAGGGAHGWNMIKLDGQWYHVDCTWDDPNEGGWERHTYFCLTDEQMAVDHEWNIVVDNEADGMVVPDAEGGEFSEENGASVDITFTSIDELDTKFDAFIAENQIDTIELAYVGTEDLGFAFSEWWNAKEFDGGYLSGYSGCSDGESILYTLNVVWDVPEAYLRIEPTILRMSVGDKTQIVPTEISPETDVITWSSSNEAVATVDASGNVTAVAEGSATITAALASGYTDAVEVTVLAPHNPEFSLTLTDVPGGVQLCWNVIPGVTDYHVMRTYAGTDKLLTTTQETAVTFASSELPATVQQSVYIIAQRKVGDTVAATYTSSSVAYGSWNISYETSIPGSIVIIGDSAFESTNLTSVSIPGSVTTIGARAFYGCTNLTAVKIPASVTSIGANAFGSTALTTVEVVEGSYADTYFATNHPDVVRIH